VGWNYRLSEFAAATALAQLEDLDNKIDKRKKSAQYFLEEIEGCDYLIPQHVPDNCVHSYYTMGIKFDGKEQRGIEWKVFRDKYVELGGDGFYAAWKLPYLEPVMYNREYVRRCPQIYESTSYEKGMCPVAESLQPKLMQFKTNYRDLGVAKDRANALRKTIKYFKKGDKR
jgi:perosamine synthetase